MKPAIYEPGEKIIVAGTVQWGTHIHCKTWDEAEEYSGKFDFLTTATQYCADASGVLSKPIEYRLYENGVLMPLHISLIADEEVVSIQASQIHNQWCARIRTNHREMFFGFESGYTMHQAQMLADSVRKDVSRMGLIEAIYANQCFIARAI